MTVRMFPTCSGNAEESRFRPRFSRNRAIPLVERRPLYLATISFPVSELSPLRYFHIFIGKHLLPALDSESSRTLFRDKEIDIVRRLDLPTNSTDFRIHTANGQVARIREEIELPLQLKNVSRTRNDCLSPEVSCSLYNGDKFFVFF